MLWKRKCVKFVEKQFPWEDENIVVMNAADMPTSMI